MIAGVTTFNKKIYIVLVSAWQRLALYIAGVYLQAARVASRKMNASIVKSVFGCQNFG
jgi:hypothetical protein